MTYSKGLTNCLTEAKMAWLNESPKGLDWTSQNPIYSELRPEEVSRLAQAFYIP